MIGVPTPPEKTRMLMEAVAKQKLAHACPAEHEDGIDCSRR
jgi:hypothetical protein